MFSSQTDSWYSFSEFPCVKENLEKTGELWNTEITKILDNFIKIGGNFDTYAFYFESQHKKNICVKISI